MPRKPSKKATSQPAPALPTHRAILAPVAPAQTVRVRVVRPIQRPERAYDPGETLTLPAWEAARMLNFVTVIG